MAAPRLPELEPARDAERHSELTPVPRPRAQRRLAASRSAGRPPASQHSAPLMQTQPLMELQRLEQQRLEQQRLEQQRLEQQRLEQQRLEERLE